MLPLKIIFQGLDGKYFYSILMEFRLYIYGKNSTISPQVVYSCFQSNIIVRKLTLLHLAHFCVLIVMHVKYNKVIEKQACRLGCKKTVINKQF